MSDILSVTQDFNPSRSCAALRAADRIVGPEYSLGGYIFGNKQKRDQRGVTTDLLDV